ncbi:MAG: hypothetical protein AVDCRST_MAG42-134 [uncultured Chthoniobacterales bacterium]|uniref:Uncharacterized protein n=1 Tax=uncultured Chthoniobacterales bacterium TaxID=1836801 RepID=A0A6J4H577_9BACT|nr:MAG: hypothetical protein AVDCRST_MAG42-134 [uncultured Chthoniobacterales bacterium]
MIASSRFQRLPRQKLMLQVSTYDLSKGRSHSAESDKTRS